MLNNIGVKRPSKRHSKTRVSPFQVVIVVVELTFSTNCRRCSCRRCCSRVDRVGDPVGGVRHAVVDSGLAAFGARVAGADDPDQSPTAFDLSHQRAAGITLEANRKQSC